MADDAATTQTTASVANMATGSFTGDGTVTNVTCGFVPRVVEVHNITDRISQLWTSDMPATNTVQTIAAGTRTLETSSLVTPTTSADSFDGFKVAAAAAVAAKVIVWTAQG